MTTRKMLPLKRVEAVKNLLVSQVAIVKDSRKNGLAGSAANAWSEGFQAGLSVAVVQLQNAIDEHEGTES